MNQKLGFLARTARTAKKPGAGRGHRLAARGFRFIGCAAGQGARRSGLRRFRLLVEAAAFRLSQGQLEDRCDHDPGEPHNDEGRAPVEILTQIAAGDLGPGHDAEGRANGNAQRVDGQRPRPAVGGEIVRDQRVGGRHAARLADADTHAREEKLPEALRKAANSGESRPDRQRDRDDPGPVGSVRQPCDGHAQRGIQRSECDAAQQAQLAVAEPKLVLDRNGQDGDDLPV